MFVFLYWLSTNFSYRKIVYMHVGIFGAAYIRCATMDKAVNGFRSTGIFPFNPDVYSDDDYAPSLTTEQPCPPTKPLSAPTTVLNEPSELSRVLSVQHRVSISDISPLPRVNHVGARKRRAQKAKVLTSSPFKRQLEEVKQKKLELEQTRSKRREKKALKEQTSKKPAKAQQQNLKKSTRKKKTKTSTNEYKKCSAASDNSEQCFCLYCHELYTDPPIEDWIQCCVCKKWCHESCAPVDSPDFVCDFCR